MIVVLEWECCMNTLGGKHYPLTIVLHLYKKGIRSWLNVKKPYLLPFDVEFALGFASWTYWQRNGSKCSRQAVFLPFGSNASQFNGSLNTSTVGHACRHSGFVQAL